MCVCVCVDTHAGEPVLSKGRETKESIDFSQHPYSLLVHVDPSTDTMSTVSTSFWNNYDGFDIGKSVTRAETVDFSPLALFRLAVTAGLARRRALMYDSEKEYDESLKHDPSLSLAPGLMWKTAQNIYSAYATQTHITIARTEEILSYLQCVQPACTKIEKDCDQDFDSLRVDLPNIMKLLPLSHHQREKYVLKMTLS